MVALIDISGEIDWLYFYLTLWHCYANFWDKVLLGYLFRFFFVFIFCSCLFVCLFFSSTFLRLGHWWTASMKGWLWAWSNSWNKSLPFLALYMRIHIFIYSSIFMFILSIILLMMYDTFFMCIALKIPSSYDELKFKIRRDPNEDELSRSILLQVGRKGYTFLINRMNIIQYMSMYIYN